jgi:hypothetical protein
VSQSYQSIGQLSPEAEAMSAERKGWQGAGAEPPGTQIGAPDISFWNRRANRQSLAAVDDNSYAEDFFTPAGDAADIPPLAGYGSGNGAYDQTPAAAARVTPYTRAAGKGEEASRG